MDHRDVVESYVAAMRRGPQAEEQIMLLFDPDVVYVEPFSGSADPAHGVEAVRQRLRQGWQSPPPDLELEVLSIEVAGHVAVSRWRCRSSAWTEPIDGTDRYTFAAGRIVRLEVTIDTGEQPRSQA